LSEFLTLRDVDVAHKRVIVREDLNVPLKDGAVADDTRIEAALATLRQLHERGARTIVLSHLGRPDGQVSAALSLAPIAQELSKRLGFPVAFAADCVGDVARSAVDALADGDVLLLENVRFHKEEEANDPAFARDLASLGDLYVNDAFGTAHRAHASTEGIAAFLPAVAGLLMEAELAALGKLVRDPDHPFVCAIGGSKVKDKIDVFLNLMQRVDAFVVGGGMANTFLAAQGVDVGRSMRDDDLGPANEIMHEARRRGTTIHLPTDAVVGTGIDDVAPRTVAIGNVGSGMILDIGPATARAFGDVIRTAKTIVFNGPMGVYEKPAYQEGTRAIGRAIADATRGGATSVVGGGDAAAAAHMLGFAQAVTHVSTGGGATLEFLEGKTLPGVVALERTARVTT
jgi:phosphoglycerate kinase